jgi:hypothetical protein
VEVSNSGRHTGAVVGQVPAAVGLAHSAGRAHGRGLGNCLAGESGDGGDDDAEGVHFERLVLVGEPGEDGWVGLGSD